MPTFLPAYEEAVAALRRPLQNLPPIIVGVDGRNGVGKTTFARFLGWTFNITVVEADLFLTGQGLGSYRHSELRRVIESRLERDRPLVLDSISLLSLAQTIDVSIHFLIHCTSPEYQGGHDLDNALIAYERRYNPQDRAHCRLSLRWGDAQQIDGADRDG